MTKDFAREKRENQIIDLVLARTNFFPSKDEISIEEIGDGNINYVYRLVEKESDKSLVVKYSDALLRSSQRPLDLKRSKIEARALEIKRDLCPSRVPQVYYYDEDESIIIMEDISAYKNLRYELLAGKIYPKLSEDLAEFLVQSLLPTADLVANRKEKKEAMGFFINPDLCDISEDLVFTEPYYNYKNRNILSPGTEDFVEERLYKNFSLQGKVLKLKDRFQSYSQGLLHGDLHTGSVFVNEDGIKVIDPEFAFYGPFGYDIGNLWGNLIFPLANHLAKKSDRQIVSKLERLFVETVDKTTAKLFSAYDILVTFPYFKNQDFKEAYLKEIIADSFAYAGLEIIRRTVGDSKVKDLTEVKDREVRQTLDKVLIATGIYLIENSFDLEAGSQVLDFINEEIKNYD